jgi:ATP-binding cassette subfamily D (ALD) long-chain fatty acid import protein
MAAQSTLRQPHDPLLALYDHYGTLLKTRVQDASKLTKIVSTITLLFTIIGAGYGGRKWYKDRRKEKETGRRLLRRNSGLKNKDGSRTIYVPYRDSTSKVVINPTKPTTFDAHRRLFLQPPRAARRRRRRRQSRA